MVPHNRLLLINQELWHLRALYVYLQHTDDLSGEFTSLIFTLLKTLRKPPL